SCPLSSSIATTATSRFGPNHAEHKLKRWLSSVAQSFKINTTTSRTNLTPYLNTKLSLETNDFSTWCLSACRRQR
ncbi:MAG: hypothetical protein ACK56I_03025, partial [bacterium]